MAGQSLLRKLLQLGFIPRSLFPLEKSDHLVVVGDHVAHVLVIEGLAMQSLELFAHPLVALTRETLAIRAPAFLGALLAQKRYPAGTSTSTNVRPTGKNSVPTDSGALPIADRKIVSGNRVRLSERI